jgi:hypothetical protein
MDKKQFRHLYKELYKSAQPETVGPLAISDHQLEKISDRVFKAFDATGSGIIIIIIIVS